MVPLLSMVFQWFCYHWTITIECIFTDWPLTSMVFQWFSPKSDTMVNNGFGPFKRHKKACNCHILNFLTNKLDDRERRQMNLTDHVNVSMSFCRLKTKSKLIGLLRPQFATIAKFQWFSKAPSPLNGMVWDNHWVQWFFDGFGVTQPLVSMVYDGCPPLVQRWNGYIPSLKSIHGRLF